MIKVMRDDIIENSQLGLTSHREVINGINMRWLESGEGYPIVLIHGIPTSPMLWRHVVSQVHGARCLCWEMVGYGESISEGHNRDISVASQASSLLAYLDHLKIERAILVGHDLGGGVAQIAAARSPHRCAGLVLVDSICYDSWPIASIRLLRRFSGLIRRLPDWGFLPMFRAFLRRGHDHAQLCEESLKLHWKHYAEHDAAACFVHQIQSLDSRDTHGIARELGRLQIPSRVIWGEYDPYQKIQYGERLAHELHTELLRIEYGKHFVPEDEPTPIVEAINDLVEHVSEGDPASAVHDRRRAHNRP
jgi:pimeloyl-ACP methyl ester carboxylesterase